MTSESIERAKEIADEWANIVTSWEKSYGERFPWREKRTPYKVFISEILLKRANPKPAYKVFKEFLEAYPDIESLFNASISDLEILIRPIGLNKQKSRLLKELATIIKEEHNGQIPSEYQSLTEFPSIGEYTASAIICFGYEVPIATVGSNVDRILCRVFSARSTEVKNIAEILLNKNEPDVYNYGLLDLGTICHYKFPKCHSCPLIHFCDYKKRGHDKLFRK